MKRILVVLSFVACSTPAPSSSSSHEILLLGEPEVATPEPARATAPAALQGPLKVFFGNLHSHTSCSKPGRPPGCDCNIDCGRFSPGLETAAEARQDQRHGSEEDSHTLDHRGSPWVSLAAKKNQEFIGGVR